MNPYKPDPKKVKGDRYTVCQNGSIDCDADNCGEWHQGGHGFVNGDELYPNDALFACEPGDTIYLCRSLDDQIGNYFLLKEVVQKAMGYQPDWVEIPMEDARSQYWLLESEEQGNVVWSPEPLTLTSIEAGKKIYSGTIYTQRFCKKFVYRTPSCVMVAVDTHCDGNKFLMIFSADKECTDEALIRAAGKW
jgi:hypothetical protein